MRKRTVDSALERQLITAMVTNKQFLGSIASMLDPSLFTVKYLSLVAKWCLDYFKEYGEAPGRSIEPIFHSWVETEKPDEADSEAVGDFLGFLSQEADTATLNVPYLVSAASDYFSLKALNRLKDNLDAYIMRNQLKEARQAVDDFRVMDGVVEEAFDPNLSKDALRDAFADPEECVIPFPGDAGRFFRQGFTRDSLIGVQAPEKRGKTWWLLELAYRALKDHRKVAMFQCGDLSRDQLIKRWAVRMAGVPMWQSQCNGIRKPTKIEIVDGEEAKTAECQYSMPTFTSPLSYSIAKKAQKMFRRKLGIPTDKERLMFSVHPMGTINIAGINSILERWKYELDFVADVILIDYADILAPEQEKREGRDMINDTWKALRRLSQEWHACVVCPTQAKRTSYEGKTQGMGEVAEDKRKNAHVTGMLALNQTPTEKRQQVMRLNWTALRESENDSERCLWVAQCIALGEAFVKGVLE